MSMIKASNITIFGGGTSGWLAAIYLVHNIKFPCKITLIESKKIGPIGVGEGTQPATARYLFDAGLTPKQWMKPSKAAFKLGVEFEGWIEKNFYVDNDFIENTQIGPDFFTTDYFVNKPIDEYLDWLPSYQLSKQNKSPKLAGLDTNFGLSGDRQYGAVHFAAYDIVDTLRKIVGDRIRCFDTEIIEVKTNSNGIESLKDKDGNIHTADLFIDCTGFESILLEKNLGVEFQSVNDILPCDSAVAIPKNYVNPQEECHPYTKATTMKAGWRWTIPIFTRIGNGYVYSSKFITPQEAEKELRDAIGEHQAPANHLKMKCGIHKVIAHKNVIAAGLSAGFVEPLEATGVTFTTKAIEILTDLLNQTQGIWHDQNKTILNRYYTRSFWEIVAFIWAHYHFSTRKDTEFWRSIREQTADKIPKDILNFVARFFPSPPREFFLYPESVFHVGHWFQVLYPCGMYKGHPAVLKGDQEKYAKYFVENNQYRVEKIIETFPNHYDYLKKWYDE